VLSEDALRRIGSVDRAEIERSIRALYKRWGAGDIDALVAALAPDVSIPSVGAWTGAGAPIRGRAKVAAALRHWGEALEGIVSVLHEIVIDGDRAVVHRTAVGRRRDDGRRYQCDFIDFFRFREGFVVEYSIYPDGSWIGFETLAR